MRIRRYIYKLAAAATLFVLTSGVASELSAQHILGVTGGIGSSSIRLFPNQHSKSVYGLQSYGITWRTYSPERVVGGFGIDVEYMQRGFIYSPGFITINNQGDRERFYYERYINTVMVPIVWQPHVYVFHRKLRLFAEGAVTFSYDFSSTYDNDYARELYQFSGTDLKFEGKYEYKTVRDNRWGYGLAGGAGFSLLLGERFEIMARVRYYYGLSDIMRNRSKYYTNNLDNFENPFTLTPIRSNIDNLNISVGLCVHLGKRGFSSWNTKPPRREKGDRSFNYAGSESVPLN